MQYSCPFQVSVVDRLLLTTSVFPSSRPANQVEAVRNRRAPQTGGVGPWPTKPCSNRMVKVKTYAIAAKKKHVWSFFENSFGVIGAFSHGGRISQFAAACWPCACDFCVRSAPSWWTNRPDGRRLVQHLHAMCVQERHVLLRGASATCNGTQ